MRKSRNPRKKERGQASVMMGVMMLTFLFFFAFVVNTGMLVNAKINLQNAADLAAYAGAAVQARQLDQISFLNYEMRRQYKKFLFRYYVLGNMAQCSFPGTTPNPNNPNCVPQAGGGGGGGGKTRMVWTPNGNATKDYGAPVVCVIFNPQDNYCQLSEIPKIATATGGGAFDDITGILNGYLKKIGETQQQDCLAVGMGNVLLLSTWLWNTDPELKMIDEGILNAANLPSFNPTQSGQSNLVTQVFSVVRGLGRGLGLVPQEVILRRRIETLASYVNTESQRNVTYDDVQGMKSRKIPEPPAFERTIQAFLSAYYTLGNHTFNAGDIQMDELMGKELLKLNDNKVHFGAFAIDFLPQAQGTGANEKNCKPHATNDGISKPIPVGVSKDTGVLTYYAIRLKAKATLMFSPFGDLQLKAYAAAQPFGSRIGPKTEESAWSRPSNLNRELKEGALTENIDRIPNLPVTDGDNTGVGQGWDTQEVMLAMHQAFLLTDGSMPNGVGPAELDRAYHTAMAPNPGEGKKYNIPYDGDDPFVLSYDTHGLMAFYAPVFPMAKRQSMNEEIKALLKEYWPGGKDEQNATVDKMVQRLSLYLDRLRQSDGEQYEYNKPQTAQGFEIVRIADPMRRRDGTRSIFSGPYHPTEPNKSLRTSWDDIRGGAYEKGRTGYSVKFVAFEYLLNRQLKTDSGKGVMTNLLDTNDPEGEADFPYIKH